MNPNEIAAAARIWRNRHETRLTNLNGPGGYAACISDEAERWAADILADAYLAHLAEHADEPVTRDLEDAAMLIRRLCHCLPGGHPIRGKALDWIRRRGLQGSILREQEG